MKKLIKATRTDVEANKAEVPRSRPQKLKRTLESGHSYEEDIEFNNSEEFLRWWEEDKLYED